MLEWLVISVLLIPMLIAYLTMRRILKKMSESNEFEKLVQVIIASPPKSGFGARHFNAGLDPNYSGPSYGRSTMMDAYFEAGKRSRVAKEDGNE